ncbi:MAG: DegT/DnrJ/EryC1/StrS family aminotransferase [Chromatiaceae bacterium]|nr:DegT/DnrJ/EryC1/StrS family aminotransferase [Chromatiaceae bacterium]MCF8002603.1 DegT/DnrJ/EryC1/StrS family aminotransferase [Chromatiaceae bacterium]
MGGNKPYPAVNTFSALYTEQTMPIAEDIANHILCLPLYWGLADQDQDRVIDTLFSTLRG